MTLVTSTLCTFMSSSDSDVNVSYDVIISFRYNGEVELDLLKLCHVYDFLKDIPFIGMFNFIFISSRS